MSTEQFEKLIRKLEESGHDMYEVELRQKILIGNYKPGQIIGKGYRDWKVEKIMEAVKDIEF